MDRRSGQTVFQGRLTDGQQAHEKMISITNHQGNENQNNEVVLLLCWGVSSHSCQDDSYQKDKKLQVLARMWRKPSSTVGGNINWCSHYRNSMEGPQKSNLELPYDSEVPCPGIYLRKTKALIRRDTCTPIHCSIIYHSQDTDTTKGPLMDE